MAGRYPKRSEHRVILIGIFRNKCLEHMAGSRRDVRGMKGLRAAAWAGDADTPVAPRQMTASEGVLHDLVQGENGRLILEAIAQLRPKAREMFRLIVEKGYSRRDLIRHYGVKKSTLDSRLHAYRQELRAILDERGFKI